MTSARRAKKYRALIVHGAFPHIRGSPRGGTLLRLSKDLAARANEPTYCPGMYAAEPASRPADVCVVRRF